MTGISCKYAELKLQNDINETFHEILKYDKATVRSINN